MKFQSFEKTDRRIISTALVLLLLSTLLLWQDDWIYRVAQTKKLNLEEIGQVDQLNNDVRRRHEVALSWLPLKHHNNVYQGDSIFTGENSTTVIKTKNGEEISIAPNSLVVINRRRDSISLNIGFGSVEGRVDNGRGFIISSNNNIAELSGNNAVVKVDAGEGNQLVLNVVSGEVNVKSKGNDKILRTDDFLEIKPDGSTADPLKPNIQILSPLADQRFKPAPDQPLVFTWQTSKQLKRMKIKIALDPDFKNTIVDARVDDNQYSAYNLPKDSDLYWQVIAEGAISPKTRISIVGDRAPIPTYPKPGTQFYFSPWLTGPQAGVPVELSWEPGSPATHYEIQLATDSGFSSIANSFKTKERKIKIALLPKGQYHWRVRSIDFANEPWSAAATFRVGPEPTQILAPPVPIMADTTFLIETTVHGESAEKIHSLRKRGAQKYIAKLPRLVWSPVAGANRYLLQVSRNRQFTDIFVSETLPRTFYTLRNIEPGQYYWRTKALGENFKDGLYTAVQNLQISVQPPVTISQASYIDEVPDPILLNAPPPPLLIKWNATVFTKGYEVEFSARSDFQDATRFLTRSSERQVQVPSPGVYYWRVRSLDQANLPVSPFSSAFSIEFQRVFKDPAAARNLAAVYPKQQDSIILVGKNKSELEFKWTKPIKDANYRLELAYDANFQSVFFTTLTKDNFYKYTEPFQARVVYWRIRTEDANLTTDWTGANRFLVAYESDSFNFEKSDIMFDARMRAQERQQKLLAAQARKLSHLRTPASNLELKLDTPQLIDPIQHFSIESNLDPNLSQDMLAKQPFDRFYSQIRNYPTFRWSKVPAAERYVIEIAKDPLFQYTVSKTPCWDPHFAWDTVRPGRFYYRVQAFNDRYARSYFSPAQKIEVSVEAPTPTSADNFVEIFDEPREMWPPPTPFTVSWTPVVFARGYEVEFSENKNFEYTKVFRTREPSTELRVSKSGLYYWRVRPVSENGIGIGNFSQTRSIEIIQTNREPASVTNLTGLFPKERTLLFVGRGLMNLAFYWVAPEPEKFYDLEISQTASFDTVLASTRTRKPQVILRKDLPEGTLYWRVRSGNNTSPINEFYLRRESQPYTEKPDTNVTQ